MLTNDNYQKYFSGNLVTDCAIGEGGGVAFTLHIDDRDWDEDEIEEGSIQYACRIYPGTAENLHIKRSKFKNWLRLYCASSNLANEHFVYVDETGSVYRIGAEKGVREKNIAECLQPVNPLPQQRLDAPVTFTVYKAKTLFNTVWVCGPRGNVAKRTGENQWEYKGRPFPVNSDTDELTQQDFVDIDGFSENDMYAIGRYHTVWHYNGTVWEKFDIPDVKLEFLTICCADNGWVYIGAEMGVIVKGRGNTWRPVAVLSPGCRFNDMLWFNDRVWVTSSAGLFYINDDGVEQSGLPEEAIQRGEFSATDSHKLLLAGNNGAIVFDGVNWNILF